MRRSSLVLSALASTVLLAAWGCDALRDAFSPRADQVARANNQTLSVDRVAEWAGGSKQVPLDPVALSRVAYVWVDYALFAQELAAGHDLRDSATVMAAMWPVVSQLKWDRLHDKITARGDLSAQQVDSAYNAGQQRIFQHILFQVPPGAPDSITAKKKRQAEQLLPQARSAGARFAQLATRYSDDPGSKTQGGSLGLSTRGAYVQAFEDAAWQLGPGEVSPVIKSPFGFHIIRRPPLSEVRDSFKVALQDRIVGRADSVYLDSLAIRKHIEVSSRAPAYVRTAVQDMETARTSGRVLVSYRGGSLRERDLVRWLAALDPQIPQALPNANDEQINQFLKAITQRQLLIQEADSAKVTLTPDDWQQVRAQHDSAIVMLGTILNLSPVMLRDSVPTPAARVDFAMARVNDYLDKVLRGRARFFPVPPFLAETLRDRARWSVDEAGVRRALERAQELRGDSTRAPGAQGAPGGPQSAPRMVPAPGPAPVDTTHPAPGARQPR